MRFHAAMQMLYDARVLWAAKSDTKAAVSSRRFRFTSPWLTVHEGKGDFRKEL